jgi:hypothetical protein
MPPYLKKLERESLSCEQKGSKAGFLENLNILLGQKVERQCYKHLLLQKLELASHQHGDPE